MGCRKAAQTIARAVAAAVALGVGAAHAACPNYAVSQAVQAKVLQTELMVAALACRQHRAYNAFIARYDADIIANGRVLRAHYETAFGEDAQARLDRFLTTVANRASLRHVRNEAAFCAEAAQRHARLSPAGQVRLNDLLRPSAPLRIASACEPQGRDTALPTASREPAG